VVTIENFQEEGVFVAESGIEAGFRNAARCGDLIQGGRLKALTPKNIARNI
jgi:hypothetical protein